MKLKFLLLGFFSFLLIHESNAQSRVDSLVSIPMISFHYSYHVSGADMALRFGNSSSVGGDFVFKTKKGYLLGLDFSFVFGENVKNKDQYFKNIQTKDGYVIDGNGMLAEVYLYERGFNAGFILGKQFNVLNINPNSGPFVQLHGGFMQHYVRIENPYKTAAQVNDNYAKLYDRMSSGLSLTEFVGYRFMSKNKLLNFYAGVELLQAWTYERRSYNADIQGVPSQSQRLELLSGFRVGWVFPLYGKSKKDFYYY